MLPKMAIAWRVDELAERRGWRARELADRASLDVKTVRNILTGRATRVDLRTIIRLAQALGVEPGELWRSPSSHGSRSRLRDLPSVRGGQATKAEMNWIFGDAPDEFPNSALERATRDL